MLTRSLNAPLYCTDISNTIYDVSDCKCSAEDSVSDQCTFSGACECKRMFTGNQCNKCIEGYGHYPECVGKLKVQVFSF